MEINKDNITRDIDALNGMLKTSSSIEEYKYIKSNLDLLLDLYKNLYKEDYEVDIHHNYDFERTISETDDKVEDIYVKEFIKDRELHYSLACKLMSIVPFSREYNGRLEEIDYDLVFKLVEDFLKSFNPKMYELYKDLSNGYIDFYTSKSNPISEANNIFMINKKYIAISPKTTIDASLSIIHELAHAYSFDFLKNHNEAYNACKSYFEFYPYFMERMFLLYLEENNLHLKDVDHLRRFNNAKLRMNANSFIYFYTKKKNELEEDSSMVCGTMVYLYGNYISGLKEADYLDDREGTLQRIDEFLEQRGSVSKEESLNILGLDKDELLSGKKLQRILKK